MNWTDYFDGIYLINLPGDTERLEKASAELSKYNIPFTVFEAHKTENGVTGLNVTMLELFLENIDKNKPILVFEDDVLFLTDPNPTMQKVVEQLKNKPAWDLCYLGINMDNENNLFRRFESENLLCFDFGYSSHAVAYSADAIIQLMLCLKDTNIPFDLHLVNYIQKMDNHYNSYCVYPLLATQREGYSNIQHQFSTYEYIPARYNHSVAHLLQNKKD